MNRPILLSWLKLRVLVGYLGERSQFGWWPTAFFDPSGRAFLSPVFARSVPLSQYHGTLEAARRVHDDFIGVGSDAFHLFRLPGAWEQDLHRLAQDANVMAPLLAQTVSREAALDSLAALAEGTTDRADGPVAVAGIYAARQKDTPRTLARLYLGAYQSDTRTYPYLAE